jgi:tRNA-Thr(GGU) m(6)t(6)A37 methyltransferase TsaA
MRRTVGRSNRLLRKYHTAPSRTPYFVLFKLSVVPQPHPRAAGGSLCLWRRYSGGVSILDRVKGILPGSKQPLVPDEPVSYMPIGVVHSRVKTSMPSGWEEVTSDVILRDGMLEALEGLEGFSHVIVVFHMHEVPAEEQRLRVVVGTDSAERGVLATRSQRRPNAIGVAVVAVVQRLGSVLRVKGLDAIDGTPVLDLKPYLPQYDAVADAKLPPWAQR